LPGVSALPGAPGLVWPVRQVLRPPPPQKLAGVGDAWFFVLHPDVMSSNESGRAFAQGAAFKVWP